MRASIILALMFFLQLGWSQTSNLNAYEHVIVPVKFDFQNEPNEYQLNVLGRILLKEEGFKVFMDKEERPLKFMGNTCEALFLEVEDTSGFLSISLIFRLKDCNDNILFESEEGKTKIKEFKKGYQEAFRQAFKSLSEVNYRYDSSLSKTEDIVVTNADRPSDSSGSKDLYPDKKIYKFGGETYWLVKRGAKDYSLLANEGIENYAELESADKGTFIFNSRTINGAAFFDADGNLTIEYRDEDLDEVQTMIFRNID